MNCQMRYEDAEYIDLCGLLYCKSFLLDCQKLESHVVALFC